MNPINQSVFQFYVKVFHTNYDTELITLTYLIYTNYYILPKRPNVFNCLVRSLWMPLMRLLHCLVIMMKPGWLGGTLVLAGRLREEQSSMN